MIKLFLILLLIINSITALSKELDKNKEETTKHRFDMLKEKFDKKASDDNQTKSKISNLKVNEWFYIYYSLGKSVTKLNNTKYGGNSTSIGYNRIAKSFIYGYEYQNISDKENYQIENHKLNLGYKITNRFRFNPYISYSFGVSNYKQLNLDKIKSFGYVNSIDIGVFLKRSLPFHFITGTKISTYSFEEENVGDGTNQEIYFKLGLEF